MQWIASRAGVNRMNQRCPLPVHLWSRARASRITGYGGEALAHAQGWLVYCIATPAAVEHFLDIPALERATGHQVRITYRRPGGEPLPKADGIIVAPATYNTINKWAAGISDTYALNQLSRTHRPLRSQDRGLAVRQPSTSGQPSIHAQRRRTPTSRNTRPIRPRRVRTTPTPNRWTKCIDAYPWSLAIKALTD